MWYFAWILGLGFAVLLAIVNAIWLEYGQDRIESFGPKVKPPENTDLDKKKKRDKR